MSAVASIPLITAAEIMVHMGKTTAVLPPPIPHSGTRTGSGSGSNAASSTPAVQASPTGVPTPAPRSTRRRSRGLTPTTAPPTPTPTATSTAINGTFQGGSYQDMFGYLSASITVTNGRISAVSISAPMDNPRSSYINSQAVPLLKSETLQAQGNSINAVSGATATSDAYYYSLTDALKKARL